MKNVLTVSASRLRIVLSITLVLLIGAGIAVAIVGITRIQDYARDVNETVVTADNLSTDTNQLKRDIAEYKKSTEAVRLAEEVVAKRESYQYQDDAYKDLLAIAKRAGVSIRQYTFSDSDPTVSATAGSQIANAPAPQSASGIIELRPSYIAFTLTSPVNYTSFLNFLHYMEQNLIKMQIKKVSLSSAFRDGVNGAVVTDELVIEVFTK